MRPGRSQIATRLRGPTSWHLYSPCSISTPRLTLNQASMISSWLSYRPTRISSSQQIISRCQSNRVTYFQLVLSRCQVNVASKRNLDISYFNERANQVTRRIRTSVVQLAGRLIIIGTVRNRYMLNRCRLPIKKRFNPACTKPTLAIRALV